MTQQRPHHVGRFDRHWLHTLAFTLSLVGLVTLAMGANLAVAAPKIYPANFLKPLLDTDL